VSPKDCYYESMKQSKQEYPRPAGHFYKLKNWLTPGLGVKRWIILVLIGTTFIGIGLGIVILDFYRNAPDSWWLPLVSAASLRILPRLVRAFIFGGVGAGILFYAIWGLNRALMKPFIKPGDSVVEIIRQHRQLERGPRIVAIGGGHGLAALLRGLKNHTYNITAVVTVADDGGSSGRIRDEIGILPPGDIRNCLAALSDDEALLGQLFQYRFPEGGGLQGHSFGNLFITALADITGSFEQAVAESGRVLAIHGEVLPSSIQDVRLQADVVLPFSQNEVRIFGESRIPESSGRIRRVWLVPDNIPVFPKVIQSIFNADIIIIGPGSLFTSIIPNLLVKELTQAIDISKAFKVYVCNIATQPGETDGLDCHGHIEILNEHTGKQLFDVCVCNSSYKGELPGNVDWVRISPDLHDNYPIYATDLLDETNIVRHDPHKLANAIIELFQEKTGPLVE
jgi:uncharacterized cofD-like protein